MGQNDVRRKRDQFCCISANAVDIAPAPAIVDPHVVAVDLGQLLQRLQKCRKTWLHDRIIRKARERAEAAASLGLLRARDQWPRGRRSDNDFDEIPSSHCPPQGCATMEIQQGLGVSGIRQRNLFARQQFPAAHVRFGSFSTALDHRADVCFPPESDHLLRRHEMTLCAISDQSALRQKNDYSITSSAPASKLDGMSRSIVLAACMLMTNSNFVGS